MSTIRKDNPLAGITPTGANASSSEDKNMNPFMVGGLALQGVMGVAQTIYGFQQKKKAKNMKIDKMEDIQKSDDVSLVQNRAVAANQMNSEGAGEAATRRAAQAQAAGARQAGLMGDPRMQGASLRQAQQGLAQTNLALQQRRAVSNEQAAGRFAQAGAQLAQDRTQKRAEAQAEIDKQEAAKAAMYEGGVQNIFGGASSLGNAAMAFGDYQSTGGFSNTRNTGT